jgi:hypothetical protein
VTVVVSEPRLCLGKTVELKLRYLDWLEP